MHLKYKLTLIIKLFYLRNPKYVMGLICKNFKIFLQNNEIQWTTRIFLIKYYISFKFSNIF